MGVLSQVNARAVVIASVVVSLTTIFGCYATAVHLHHVKAWLPMISDCGVDAPEKYPFRLGIISSALLIMFNAYLVWAISGSSASKSNTVAFISALGGAAGLAVVGAVNEAEDNSVHGTAAVIFFFLYELYMIIITVNLFHVRGKTAQGYRAVSDFSLTLKVFALTVGTVALALFVYMNSDWGKYSLQIAICEWTGTMMIQLFNISFVFEYGTDYKLDATIVNSVASYAAPKQPALPLMFVAVASPRVNSKTGEWLDQVAWKPAAIV
ncbi:hypothetical protein CAOG_06033 [Capsaspora owczarzaki ATCC 30864]|uniref:CWH43-like N-terminal domain-containing protein n=1 Tax=Capsaspora owczarzaki (strain ATCC 30864) TaxID=595528 RepID=A0A0D2WT94_CAPO3|nr:hypothetical protein CAOG_06033 [Capsaspora owczarzaki ATCC 30864]KJE95595.1 hypothetical protein CAOG_006033 [Capsaspora owczarzaki ATCC 30864]|eukprot:XP_004345623.1 hypothetical protein CAOG_06033 [Capsaspora owczarzaki ATCC 30864]